VKKFPNVINETGEACKKSSVIARREATKQSRDFGIASLAIEL